MEVAVSCRGEWPAQRRCRTANSRLCRETNGKSGWRRRCGCHPRAMPSSLGRFARLGGREGSVSSRLGSLYSSRFLMNWNGSMNQVQVEQKTYRMPPQEGFTVAHFLTVADIERSPRFYETVFGGRILSRGDSRARRGTSRSRTYGSLSTPGAARHPTNHLTPSVPANPDFVSSFMNIRVADIQACYKLWRSRGAEFITEPKPKYGETRCYIRDPDGYIIEVGQSKPGFAYG